MKEVNLAHCFNNGIHDSLNNGIVPHKILIKLTIE